MSFRFEFREKPSGYFSSRAVGWELAQTDAPRARDNRSACKSLDFVARAVDNAQASTIICNSVSPGSDTMRRDVKLIWLFACLACSVLTRAASAADEANALYACGPTAVRFGKSCESAISAAICIRAGRTTAIVHTPGTELGGETALRAAGDLSNT